MRVDGGMKIEKRTISLGESTPADARVHLRKSRALQSNRIVLTQSVHSWINIDSGAKQK